MRRFKHWFALLLVGTLLTGGAVVGSISSAEAATYNLKATLKYTAVHLSWKSQGSGKTYQVQYATSSTFSSAKTATTTGTSTTVNRLASGKTWYFRVRAVGSSWSPKVSKKTYRPSSYGGNKVEKAYKITTDNVSGSTIDLSWSTPSAQFACFRIAISPTPPSGQPAVQCTTAYTLTGLQKGTKYVIKLYTVAPAEKSDGISWPAIDISGASSSVSRTTSNYALAAPDDLTLVKPQRTYQATVKWTASPNLAAGDSYRILMAANSGMTKSKKWYGTKTTDTQMTMVKLSSNGLYYIRVVVVDANNKQRSDFSGYLLVKTLPKYGILTGSVSTSAPKKDLVAVAYDSSGEVQAQSDIASNGSYSLRVAPGTDKVRITYIGSDNYYSSWVSATASPAVNSSQATRYSVANEATTTLPTTTIGQGYGFSGTVIDAKTGNTVSGATVTISNVDGSTETIGSVYSSGSYSFNGVPAGNYRIRASYVGSTVYKSINTYTTVSGNVSGYVIRLPRK